MPDAPCNKVGIVLYVPVMLAGDAKGAGKLLGYAGFLCDNQFFQFEAPFWNILYSIQFVGLSYHKMKKKQQKIPRRVAGDSWL